MNIADILETAAHNFPDNLAIIDEKTELTFGQLNCKSNKIASQLVKNGVSPGDHVALIAPNSSDWVIFYFGVLKAGAVAVTLAFTMTADELQPLLEESGPKVVFTVDGKKDNITRGSYMQTVICDHGDLSFSDMLENGSDQFKNIDRNPDDTAAVLYTSGTTALPKGVMLTHENIMTSVHNVVYHERSCENDSAVCFLPLNHVFAQIHILNATISSAGMLVIHPSFDMNKFLLSIQEFKITKLYAVPTIYIRMLSLSDIKEKLGSVRYCFSAAASMAQEVVRGWKLTTGLDIFEAYGMTESASMVTFNHYKKHVTGSVGTPAHGIAVQIRDTKGNILGNNTKGEVCISGPNIMKGYLKRPCETKDAFWGKWFRSGDVGIIDDNSYLYIVDRIKELIITGGENVSPREIEEVLYTRKEVEECAVIGLPDREYGERITAFIIPKNSHAIDPHELKRYLKTRLSPFKIPKEFIMVSELPKNSTGKLLKRELREQFSKSRLEKIKNIWG